MTQSSASSFVFVVAGVLVSATNEILLAQRSKGSMAGLWEFPGGKLEHDESPKMALMRELHEELDIGVAPTQLMPLIFVDHAYPDFNLFMPVYLIKEWVGQPKPIVHQNLTWCASQDLLRYPMPEADVPIVSAIKRVLDLI